MPLAIGDHAARVAAAKEWLESLCGDYAPLRRQFIAGVFPLSSRRRSRRIGTELAERVKPYDGLYAPEDFLWSALRPLPRGWVPAGDALLPADVVFWDGARAIAIELSARETEKQKALAAAGVSVCRIEPVLFDRLGEVLPRRLSALLARPGAAVEPVPPCHPTGCPVTVIVRPVIASAAKQSPSRCAPGWRFAAPLRSQRSNRDAGDVRVIPAKAGMTKVPLIARRYDVSFIQGGSPLQAGGNSQ